MNLSPLEVEILLHIYCGPSRFENDHTEVYASTIKTFLTGNIIAAAGDTENGYRVTERGDCWVQAILSTPMPRAVYVDSHDNIITSVYDHREEAQ